MERYICVHGHFYQPPRENPWLEAVEQQDEAYPFHDWNERITAECYAPNTRARILDDQGRITRLINNYARLSFNIGPTLLSWMQEAAPTTYEEILAADARSVQRYGGHGSAMAQVYNHVIMPLADPRDQRTQVVWGIRDFRHRFGRDPEGMWLAETAVDDQALDLLAEHGVSFVVLSPHQAARTRPLGEDDWNDVTGGRVDPTMPYVVELASGRTITVFFYDGPISQAVAFEGLLDSADRFERRLLDGFGDREGPQLVNIATDGESYGHHHPHGEMALAATLDQLAQRDDIRVTNYGEYLALHPPTHQAEVVQASSWSCSHGVERWRADCGCSTGSSRHQRWRAPLRAALDDLRAALARDFEKHAAEILADPWAARDDYIDVVLDRETNLTPFLERHGRAPLGVKETRQAVQWLEVQRNALLMFSSCGWFFDELSRPEPVQVLFYAARAIQLHRRLTGNDLEPGFVRALADAPSNEARFGDGRGVYEQIVRPAIADLAKVGAHVAISSLSWTYGRSERVGAYEVQRETGQVRAAGRAKLGYGRLTVRSVVSLLEAQIEFAVLHLGDHNFVCGVRPRGGDEAYEAMGTALDERFHTADFPDVVRAIDDHFNGPSYSLRTLFRDERQRILDSVLRTAVEEAETSYREIYRARAPLMRFLADLGAPVPTSLKNAAEIVVNAELRAELGTAEMDLARVGSSLEDARRYELELDEPGLAYTLSTTVARISAEFAERLRNDDASFTSFEAQHEDMLDQAGSLLDAVELVPFEVDLTPAQDVMWQTLKLHGPGLKDRADSGDAIASRWLAELIRVAEVIHVVPPDLTPGRAVHAGVG